MKTDEGAPDETERLDAVLRELQRVNLNLEKLIHIQSEKVRSSRNPLGAIARSVEAIASKPIRPA